MIKFAVMDKSDFYDKIIALGVGLITFLMPLVDMFLVAGVFVLMAFVMEKEAEKKEAKDSNEPVDKYGFWRGFFKVLRVTLFRGLFVASAYFFDSLVASKYLYPLLQDRIHPGIDYVVTLVVLAGTCYHYFSEADRNCKKIYGKGIIDSLGILFSKLYTFALKLKDITKKEE